MVATVVATPNPNNLVCSAGHKKRSACTSDLGRENLRRPPARAPVDRECGFALPGGLADHQASSSRKLGSFVIAGHLARAVSSSPIPAALAASGADRIPLA